MHKRLIVVTGLLCSLALAFSGFSGVKNDSTVNTVQSSESLPESGGVNMYRLYLPLTHEHFYTSDENEKNTLIQRGWHYEGVGWIAPTSGTPVYRLYNSTVKDHLYTSSKNEKNVLKSRGWTYEGIGWYSDTNKSVPVYRQYCSALTSGSHNYTTSANERDVLSTRGWKYEGVAWYGVESTGSSSSSTDTTTASDDSSTTSSTSSSGSSGNATSGGDANNCGNVGNLTIPAIGTDVALYNNDTAQNIVNRENAAAYLEGFAEPIIGDHCYQSNFNQLKNCQGQYCYVIKNGTTTRYQCVSVQSGTNTTTALITSSGVNITANRVSDLVIYTCQSNSTGESVWITEWNVA